MQSPIEVAPYLLNPESEESISECKRVVDLLHRYGAIAIRDPRVTFDDNAAFLDIVEAYFEQDDDVKMADSRPEHHFQVGVTPELTEVPGCSKNQECLEYIETLPEEHKPLFPEGADVKWRFFHRLEKTPEETEYGSLNLPPVEPINFPNWLEVMDRWGSLLKGAGYIIAEMLAVGLDLEKNTFTRLMDKGPHLLAPTATNLTKYGTVGTIMAGFHQDLNFMTFHGKSRFSGLNIWLHDDTKQTVSIPDGCILAQSGMMLEHLTGGFIKAGYHEVVVTEKTLEGIERAKSENRSLWRISSTVFMHIASDETLIQILGTEEEKAQKRIIYPDIKAGAHVERVLASINLKKDN